MIRDPEVQLLAALAEGLKSDYQTEEDLSWSQGSFGRGPLTVQPAGTKEGSETSA